ncbi:MAG TPA: DUF4115 domain-containing protein [Gaiellaceae bacterium]|nr:DUF4115 domain-containing protein [Gaiellaceae bacterium]
MHDPKALEPPSAAAAATVTPRKTQPVVTKKIVVRLTHAKPKPLVIDAARGDCWLQVRSGGATGAVVYEGTLRSGSTMRFAQSSLWVRFGAPANVDAERGGKSVAGLAGSAPADVVA